MSDSNWVCKHCGRVGGFICKGFGIIICSGCQTSYIVLASGRLCKIFKEQPLNGKSFVR